MSREQATEGSVVTALSRGTASMLSASAADAVLQTQLSGSVFLLLTQTTAAAAQG